MAVTITAIELAAAMRIGDGSTALVEPQASVISRLLASATTIVERYAPNAPTAIQNEAVVRVAGYLYDAPPGASARTASAMRDSGAMALLSPWRIIRAVAVESDDSDTPTPITPGTGGGSGLARVTKTLNAEAIQGLASASIPILDPPQSSAYYIAHSVIITKSGGPSEPVTDNGGIWLAITNSHALLTSVVGSPPDYVFRDVLFSNARGLVKAGGYAEIYDVMRRPLIGSSIGDAEQVSMWSDRGLSVMAISDSADNWTAQTANLGDISLSFTLFYETFTA